VVEGTEEVSLVDVAFIATSGELSQSLEKVQRPAGSTFALKTQKDCEFIVEHLGSHYGDVQHALKLVVGGQSTEGVFFLCL
jgi:hypothetical protein